MIEISEALPFTDADLRSALAGKWGADGDNLALGKLSIQLLFLTDKVEPLSFANGAETAYSESLLIASYADGSSEILRVTEPITTTKQIAMGVLIARQT